MLSREKMDEFEKQEIQQRARAEQFRASAPEKFGLVPRVVDIYSDGTRMTATIWRSKSIPVDKKIPGILLCGGFGSKRSQLDFSYASRFAQAGFAVVTFDYRGWGDSDGILLAAEKQPTADPSTGLVNIRARIVRKYVLLDALKKSVSD
jgi:predicted acyl esterase